MYRGWMYDRNETKTNWQNMKHKVNFYKCNKNIIFEKNNFQFHHSTQFYLSLLYFTFCCGAFSITFFWACSWWWWNQEQQIEKVYFIELFKVCSILIILVAEAMCGEEVHDGGVEASLCISFQLRNMNFLATTHIVCCRERTVNLTLYERGIGTIRIIIMGKIIYVSLRICLNIVLTAPLLRYVNIHSISMAWNFICFFKKYIFSIFINFLIL